MLTLHYVALFRNPFTQPESGFQNLKSMDDTNHVIVHFESVATLLQAVTGLVIAAEMYRNMLFACVFSGYEEVRDILMYYYFTHIGSLFV